MSTIKQNHGTPASATNSSTTVVVATIPALPNRSFQVTDVSGFSNNPYGTITVFSGSSVLWQTAAGASAYEHTFMEPLICAVNATCTVVTAGTLLAYASVAGFYAGNTSNT